METTKERAARLITEMRKDLENRGEPRKAICLRCQCRFTAYGDAQNLCSKQCREEYLDRPRKFAKGEKKGVAKPMQFTIRHRTAESEEQTHCPYGVLNWLIEQDEENEANQREFWKNFVLTLSIREGVDSGSHLILRIS